jgi:V/A-type H+-transporting ATPase subunit I
MTRAFEQRFLVAAEIRPLSRVKVHPVQLNTTTLVKPYEIMFEMFSPPSHEDVDPSPLLAPFFFLFFGMMLSDIGYGLVLTGLTGYMAFKKKATGEMGRMSRMLFISGIGSIIWGILFGGFFGDMLTVLSQGKIVVPSLWFNPMEEPMPLMVWSMLFGVLHLFTAMGAKIYLLAKTARCLMPWSMLRPGIW